MQGFFPGDAVFNAFNVGPVCSSGVLPPGFKMHSQVNISQMTD